ncbi:YciI family protein [Pseudotenacibaculum sp. MALMAid0570]|uniref:YciI family protein n=1 Tax=Pseudotenacibaculum sp. MALMAid0570 TaxID=3143938 RepID=UPI0032DF0051
MSNFLYLFRGGDEDFNSWTPEQQQAHMLVWEEWMGNLAQKGKLLGGEQLFDGGKIVKDKGEIITDGPFVEGAEMVGGYVIVVAADLNEAVQMSKTCPIFDYKGAFVEVREIASKEH